MVCDPVVPAMRPVGMYWTVSDGEVSFGASEDGFCDGDSDARTASRDRLCPVSSRTPLASVDPFWGAFVEKEKVNRGS